MWKIIVVVMVVCVSFFLGRYTTPAPIEDIVVVYDTIREPAPPPIIIPTDEYKELYFNLKETSSLAINKLKDSINNSEPRIEYDTITEEVKVYVPMSDYIFQDSLYKATMRGYNIHNFAIEVYAKNTTTTKIIPTPTWFVNGGTRALIANNTTSLYATIGIYHRHRKWEYGVSYNKGLNNSDFYEFGISYNLLSK